MKTKLTSAKNLILIIALFVIFLFGSCHPGASSESKDSTGQSEKDTINLLSRDSIPDYGNDTLFSEKTFTADDSARYLIKSISLTKPVSVEACEVSVSVKDFLLKLSSCHFIAFEFPNTHIPLMLQGEVVNGLHPIDPPASFFPLHCENLHNPEVITSVGRHSVWIRRLFLPKQEIADFLIRVAQNVDFSDLMTNREKYKIIITPVLGVQQIHPTDPIEEYVGGDISVMKISTNQTSAKARLHPCPVCE